MAGSYHGKDAFFSSLFFSLVKVFPIVMSNHALFMNTHTIVARHRHTSVLLYRLLLLLKLLLLASERDIEG